MRLFQVLTALLGLFLMFSAGCGGSLDNFVATGSSNNASQEGLTLQVSADPASLRGVRGRFQPAVTQLRVTVFNLALTRVGQQTVPRNGTAVFNNLPSGTYYVRVEGLLTGGTVVGFLEKRIALNSNQTELFPGLKITNSPPPPTPNPADFESPTPFFIFTIVPDPVVSGSAFSVSAQVLNADGSPVTSAISGVTLVSNSTPFERPPVVQATDNNGVVTFSNLSFPANTTGTAQLVIEAPGVDSATSGTIQINAASNPTFLQFTSVPNEVTAGATFSVTAQVFNADNSPVSAPVSGVSLVSNGVAFASNPSSQTSDSSGVVTFSNLSYPPNASGTATLTVDAVDATAATSGGITITMAATSFLEFLTNQNTMEIDDYALSSDGRFVTFGHSGALIAGDTNSTADIFVQDRLNNTLERVSVDGSGAQVGDPSFSPDISGDGRFVTFSSESDALVPGDSNGRSDVFVYDRTNDTIEIVSVDSSEAGGNGSSFDSTISADGRYVAFVSQASNLVSGDTNGQPDIFVRDRTSGTTERISVSTGGAESNAESDKPKISSDGNYVAFTSDASNLVAGGDGFTDIFVRDLINDTTERVSLTNAGAAIAANGLDSAAAISGDGRFVVFCHGSSAIVAGDTNGSVDVFVRDRLSGTTERVSLDSTGAESNDHSSDPDISDDGRYVVFASLAANLVSGDTNGNTDIFLRDRDSGTTSAVSIAPGQTATAGGNEPKISGSGNAILFTTQANLVVGDTGARDLYIVSNPPPAP